MTRKKVLLTVFALISVASFAGTILSSGKSAAEHTIRFSLLGSAEDEDYDGAVVFKEHIENASKGRIAVELYPSGQFCSTERECLEAIQSGVLQVFMFTTGGFGSVYGPAQVLDLPYVFRDDAVAECVLDGPITAELSRTILAADIGIRLMTVSNTGGWRNFIEQSRRHYSKSLCANWAVTRHLLPGPKSIPPSQPALLMGRKMAFTILLACSCMSRLST